MNKPKFGIAKPKKFTVKLSKCGTDTCAAHYNAVEDTSALRLSNTVCNTITDSFVGEELSPQLRYHLACALLFNLDGWDEKTLLKDIKKAKKYIQQWKFDNKKSECKHRGE